MEWITFRAGDQQRRSRHFAADVAGRQSRVAVGASPIRGENDCRSARAVP
jgi:hypothetical protein